MTSFVLLAISLVEVAIAPILAALTRRSATFFAATDSFVATMIGALAVVHILPHTVAVAGVAALVAAAVGALVPTALHHAFHRLERWAMPIFSWLVLGFLALHATLDGAALAAPDAVHGAAGHEHETAPLLGAAVVLHRFPMVLGIWWFAVPRLGRWAATALLVALGIGTVVGYVAVDLSWAVLGSRPIALIQALATGMLFHVLIGHEGPETRRAPVGRRRLAIAIGTGVALMAMLGMALLGTLELPAAAPLSTLITIGVSLAVAAYVLQARWRQRHAHAHDRRAAGTES